MSKHTPGPWNFSDNTTGQLGGWKTNPYSVTVQAKGVNRTTLANIPDRATIPDEQRRANALLIAAAPDLLLALKNLELGVSLLDARLTHDHKNASTAWDQLNQYMQDARVIIAKAIGEQ